LTLQIPFIPHYFVAVNAFRRFPAVAVPALRRLNRIKPDSIKIFLRRICFLQKADYSIKLEF